MEMKSFKTYKRYDNKLLVDGSALSFVNCNFNLSEKFDSWFWNANLEIKLLAKFGIVKPKISSRYIFHRSNTGKE